MNNDELIWKTIAFNFCSYKVSTETVAFCRNEYNLTGLCNRLSCPLANSQYATIKLKGDRLYLYTKTIERAHTPAKLWSATKLSKSYAKALEQVDKELEFHNDFQRHKSKQRLTKLFQMLIRSRKKEKVQVVGINKKIERREERRAVKAEKAAKLEHSIEKALLERLRQGINDLSGMYGEIVNEHTEQFEQALDELEEEMDYVSDYDSALEDSGSDGGSTDDSSDSDSDSDDSDGEKRPRKKGISY